MKKILYIIFVFIFSVIVYTQSKIGTTAAPFLSIGVGPRSIAMGGAFSATANDVTSLYWNPAGLANLDRNEAQFAHTEWFAGITNNWAGAAINLGSAGSLGLSMTYLDYGEMEVTTLREQDGTGELFSAKDMSFALSYAYRLTDRFSIGMNFKYINQKIWNSSADAFAVDIGTLFISDINGLRIGATISNFGTDMTMSGKDLLVLYDPDKNIFGNNDQILASLKTDPYPLPLLFRVGLAMDVVDLANHKVTIAVDALHPNDNDESVNIGFEYVFNKMISFRAGYKSLFLSNSEEGLTLGMGFNYDFAPNLGLYVNYAYQDFGVLKSTQHFALGIKF